ncbi:hypothetical protein ACFOG5_02195 [Pedobacter fastidiosus]|uniref:Uncharacterized protein n=1 Tax=Pedobacter fastidiosus TaxID=2765361 RepID=A0ABR7KWK2_9SPHI|nr:hypothetical protein [Pedobacter fastidiosus]
MQKSLIIEYRAAFRRFSSADIFSPSELDYFSGVYGNLFSVSLNNLDELATVLTVSQLRMSDDERLRAIDRIYASSVDRLSFLKKFNNDASLLMLQRKRARSEVAGLQGLYKNP